MQTLDEFFKKATTLTKSFYPTHYAVFSFRTYSVAQQAADHLISAGYDDVIFIPAKALLDFLEEQDLTLTGMFMNALSRGIQTESAKSEADAERARMGGAFVAVRCPQEADAMRALELLGQFEPMAMDYYEPGGVNSPLQPAPSDPVAVKSSLIMNEAGG